MNDALKAAAAAEQRIEALVNIEARRLRDAAGGPNPTPTQWRRIFDRARLNVHRREKQEVAK